MGGDGTAGSAGEQLGEDPAGADLTFAGVGAVEDFVEEKEDREGAVGGVDDRLELADFGVEVTDAAFERVADADARAD
ncbi:hypothetical protein D3C83_152360 [compost metagenome]